MVRLVRAVIEGKADKTATVPRLPATFRAPVAIRFTYASAVFLTYMAAAFSGRWVWNHDLSPISVTRAALALITIAALLPFARLVAGRRISPSQLRSWLTLCVPLAALCGVLRFVDHAASGVSI